MSSVGRPFFQEFATSINPRGKCRLGYQNYTNSFFNANSFYVNFTNMTFQKIPIPHLTCMYSDSFSIAHFASCCISLLWLTQYFRRKKVALTKELVYIFWRLGIFVAMQTKVITYTGRHFYRTENEIWIGFGFVGYTKKDLGSIMSNFWGRFFHVFSSKIFIFRYCNVRSKKFHIKDILKTFFFGP